jgi:hypothetical protein
MLVHTGPSGPLRILMYGLHVFELQDSFPFCHVSFISRFLLNKLSFPDDHTLV